MTMDLTPPGGLQDYVAGVCGVLDFTRQRLKATIADLQSEQLETTPPGFTNSIAALVVHICASEVRRAHNCTGDPIPADVRAEFLLDEPNSPLPVPAGETAATLAAKLDRSWSILLAALRRLRPTDLDRVVELRPGHPVTVRWAVALLGHHQAIHLGHIQMILQALEPPGFM